MSEFTSEGSQAADEEVEHIHAGPPDDRTNGQTTRPDLDEPGQDESGQDESVPRLPED
jgi:hypothetical protein